MRKSLLPALALIALASPAAAQVLEDPLHGYVELNGTPTNTDTGSISPLNLQNPNVTGFGFYASPAPQSGDLNILVLVPTNLSVTISPVLSGNLTGGSFSKVGTWTSASGLDLADFLGLANAKPTNPFSGYATPDSADLNGKPTAFDVYVDNLGPMETLQDISTSTMVDNISGLLPGMEISAFMVEPGTTVMTASSGVLMVTNNASPVPGPIAGAGLPGVVAGCGALLALALRRRKQRTA
jgi:hypothetical protein